MSLPPQQVTRASRLYTCLPWHRRQHRTGACQSHNQDQRSRNPLEHYHVSPLSLKQGSSLLCGEPRTSRAQDLSGSYPERREIDKRGPRRYERAPREPDRHIQPLESLTTRPRYGSECAPMFLSTHGDNRIEALADPPRSRSAAATFVRSAPPYRVALLLGAVPRASPTRQRVR